jgi:UDP-N-acetylmuramoyl-tripeptide--D-alanyl-D-alanine ligase
MPYNKTYNIMTVWTKDELISALSEEILEHNLRADFEIDEVVIDSRKTPKSGLFIAIKGENNDAHDFIEQAFKNSCRVALIQDQTKIPSHEFILVKNSIIALYKLAKYSRNRSKAKIIAITGSVGKTSTKEMLKLVFDSQGKTFATHGNLNNHIGLPLSLANFSSNCDYGIFEMGMNHLGEINPLSKLTKPHLAIITNVGPVHIEFFKNEEEIALAKSEIFSGLVNSGSILINQDSTHLKFLKKRADFYNIKNIFSFGKNDTSSNYQLNSFIINSANSSTAEVTLRNHMKISYEINTSNPAIIFNSIIAIAALDLIGHDLPKGIKTLENIENPAGRGKIQEIKINTKTITIIDDSYNASTPSMHAGLEHATNLKKILGKKRVVAALGDMLELGEKSVELHNQIIDYLEKFHVDFAVLVGKNMIEAAKNLSIPYKTFLDSSLASQEIENFLNDGDILYIKGSRGMKMEKIIQKYSAK